MNPTQKQINAEIEKLKEERNKLPEFSKFGDPNHRIIDLQIEILKGDYTEAEIWDMEDDDFTSEVISEVLNAFHFLDGDFDSLTE